jgi:hypothetical protein
VRVPRLGHISELSRCSVKLHVRDTEDLAIGTGFFYRIQGHCWLVTAGHNVTGLHAETGEALSPGRLPTEIRLALGEVEKEEESGVRFGVTTLQLFNAGDTSEPVFRTHPAGREVDVAALPMENGIGSFHLAVNDDLDCTEDFRVEAGCDAFILGYPEGLSLGGHIPLWKRATVASDPSSKTVDFLVDTATRSGMSGSPVFVRETGIITPNGARAGPAGGLSPDAIFGQAFTFAGVYTSRPLPDQAGFLAQLGRVFTAGAIDEVLADP